ncbi:MAG: DUF447 domain-containing protein [Candidatus Thermoplasmatota archaeon]
MRRKLAPCFRLGEKKVTDSYSLGTIKDGRTYECIVTTMYNNKPHSAPIGVKFQKGKAYMKIFKGRTYENILKEDKFFINLISENEIELIFSLAIEKKELPLSMYSLSPFPHLKSALGYMVCKIEERKKEKIKDEMGKAEVLVIKAKLQKIVMKKEHYPLSRAPNALLEAIIYATKKKKIEEYIKIARRTGDRKIKRLAKKLYERISINET